MLPPETTGYRAINSEGDLCPGVLLDVYGETAVLELLTEGTEAWATELEAAAREVFAPPNWSSARAERRATRRAQASSLSPGGRGSG